jgi:lysophospholipase L1-like esterase
LLELLQQEKPAPADVAVIVVGVNDLTSQVPLLLALEWRLALARWLRANAAVAQVFFTSMPEMQHFPLMPQPLAWYAGLLARRNNLAQARWARYLRAVHHIDLSGLTRAEWMAPDGYHPAPPLYAQVCARVAAAIAQHRGGNIVQTNTTDQIQEAP